MNIAKKQSNNKPPLRVICSPSPLIPYNMLPETSINAMADNRLNGISRDNILLLNFIGYMRAAIPKMNKALNMLLPRMFPRERPELPFIAEPKLITNSGNDVPNATMVSPMTNSLILKRLASADAPSVSRLAPKRIRTSPPMKNKIESIMFF